MRATHRLLTFIGVLGLMGAAGTATAFETYNDGCQNCHDSFFSGTSQRGQTIRFDNKHDMHRSGNGGMEADCGLCHISFNSDPKIGESDGGPDLPGVGCNGCHAPEGLRAHHEVSGINSCDNCHSDDGPPDPENIWPVYYGSGSTLVSDSCNATAAESTGENWTVGDLIGLDNDGDGLYDGDDSDCSDGGPDPVPPVADAGKNTFGIDRDQDGLEDVTLDGSGSTDENDDIAEYIWRENGEIIARGVSPTVTFAVGIHDIELKVKDDENLSDTDTLSVRVFAKPVTLLTPVADTNGNSTPDFAAAMLSGGKGKFFIYVRDGADASRLLDVNVGALELRHIGTLKDISGNSLDEVMVLTVGDGEELLVRLYDSKKGTQVSKLKYGRGFEPFALLGLNDRDQGLGGRAVAVVQIDGDGKVQTLVRDALTAGKIASLRFSKAYVPFGAAVIRDVDGNNVEEIVIFGENADGLIRAQAIDALTGEKVFQYQFNKNYAPVATGSIPSINPNGRDELVVVGVNGAGKVRAEVLESKNGKVLATINFDPDYPPLAMAYVDHPDGPALAVLGEDADGKRQAQTRFIETGELAGRVAFPASSAQTAADFAPLDDANGSGVPELIMIGETDNATVKVVGRDAADGAQLFNTKLP